MKNETANKTVTVNGQTYKVGDLFRKTYAVETSNADGCLWDEEGRFDNSADANTLAAKLEAKGETVRVVVVEVSDVPKKAFWDLWRTAQGKAALKAAGVYVTKHEGQFVATEEKVSRREILCAKGYGGMSRDEQYYVDKSVFRGEYDALEAEGYSRSIVEEARQNDEENAKLEESAQ